MDAPRDAGKGERPDMYRETDLVKCNEHVRVFSRHYRLQNDSLQLEWSEIFPQAKIDFPEKLWDVYVLNMEAQWHMVRGSSVSTNSRSGPKKGNKKSPKPPKDTRKNFLPLRKLPGYIDK